MWKTTLSLGLVNATEINRFYYRLNSRIFQWSYVFLSNKQWNNFFFHQNHLVIFMYFRVHNDLTPLAFRPGFSGQTWSMQTLPIPWLFVSPGHQQPRYRWRMINVSLLSVRKDFNRPISQIPHKIAHNAPFCYRNVHVSVTEWCIVGYGIGVLWDLCNKSITCSIPVLRG